MKVLVTGATGSIGGAVLTELRKRGADVRAGARNPEKARTLEERGFDVVPCDFVSSEQLAEAVRGVDSVLLVSAHHPQQAEHQNAVVDAAAGAGVRHIVKVSAGSAVMGADSPSWVGRAHTETEEHIEASGLEYTFLRPNYFMKNLVMLAEPMRTGVLPVPVHDEATAMIDHRDIAAAAAEVLRADGGHSGEVYELTGPESLPFSQVAERVGTVLDREIRYVDPPEEAAIDNLRKKGAPEWLQDHMRQILAAIREGRYGQTTDAVQQLTGRPPRPVEDFVRDHRPLFD